jgi:alpha-amylase
MKWLTDWVRELGFDGYRLDTAKHFEPAVSDELKREAQDALASWRRTHRHTAPDTLPFYMVGEVYGWELSGGRTYDFGDRKVDFFSHGYDGLVNFGFKADTGSFDRLFSRYSSMLDEPELSDVSILNYLSSHDDGAPYDRERKDPFGGGTRLLLAPGGAQIYYGDELARPLQVPGAEGDANLRSFMNWADLEHGGRTAEVLEHWRRLGRFRRNHPSVGAGVHRTLQAKPYIFSRTLESRGRIDRVLVAMDQGNGARRIPVFGTFPNGTELMDAYSGGRGKVVNGVVSLARGSSLVLLAELK